MPIIVIAKDFSATPGGRFRHMGPSSGEEFREMLRSLLVKKPLEPVEVVLDGAEGYGSSFLEEAFGGLIRQKLISPEDATRRIKIVARSKEYETYAEEARAYMKDAADALKK